MNCVDCTCTYESCSCYIEGATCAYEDKSKDSNEIINDDKLLSSPQTYSK